MAEWPMPPSPRRRDARRPAAQLPRAQLPPEPAAPTPGPAEGDGGPTARILQWPGPRTPDRAEDLAGAARPGRVHPAAGQAKPGRAVLVPVTAVLVLWSLTCLVDGVRPPLLDRLFTAAAAFAPLAVVAAIVVVALAVRARLWVTTAVAAAAGLLPWVFVAGYAVPGSDAVPAGSARVAVMLLDADAGRADAPSVVAAVARQPVDVLVVTETTPLLAHALTAAGLDPRLAPRWVSVPAGSAGGGIAVYSRYRVRGVEPLAGTRWPAARITLDTGHGAVALVVGRASPPGQGPERWRSDLAALAAAARAGGPAVVAGTLDATPEQPAFRRMTGGGLDDAAAALGRGLRPTWPSWSPLPVLPLDHVLVGGGVGVRSVTTLAVAGTSHRALVTNLVAPSGATPGAD